MGMIREFARLVKHVSKEECQQALSDLSEGKYKNTSTKLD